jgi:hypothetical protein
MHRRLFVALLTLVLLTSPGLARADDSEPVIATVWQSASFASNADPATQTGGALAVDVPLPLPETWLKNVNQPRLGATLEILSQPEAAFSFADVKTFGRALRFDVNVRMPFASTTEGQRTYTLSLYGEGGFSTLIAGVDRAPRQRYAREWACGVHLDAPGGAWMWTGFGHSDVVAQRFKLHWLGGGQVPIPSADAIVLGLRYAVNIFQDSKASTPSFDHALVYVGVDPVKLVGAIVH